MCEIALIGVLHANSWSGSWLDEPQGQNSEGSG